MRKLVLIGLLVFLCSVAHAEETRHLKHPACYVLDKKANAYVPKSFKQFGSQRQAFSVEEWNEAFRPLHNISPTTVQNNLMALMETVAAYEDCLHYSPAYKPDSGDYQRD